MAYPSRSEIEKMYEAREKLIASLLRKKQVTLHDLEKTDRIGRFRIAAELWPCCTSEVRNELLHDLSHSVRSAALISSQRSNEFA